MTEEPSDPYIQWKKASRIIGNRNSFGDNYEEKKNE